MPKKSPLLNFLPRAIACAATLILSVPIASAAVPEGSGGPAAPFEHFITRRGDRLYDGDKPFRFFGANMPGLVLPYDYTMRLPERMTLPTPWEQEDAFKTLVQMNFKVVRTWNLPMRGPKEAAQPWHYVLAPGEFNDEAFKVVDQMFALANRYGVRVIFPLTADAGDYLGGIGTYAEHRGKPRAEFYTDPQLREDYKATLRHVLNRTNAITGVRYCDDKAVLAWQFGNEMFNAPDAWLAEMGAYLKTLTKNQLVAEARHVPANPMFVDANIDLVTRHLYGPPYPGVEAGWPATLQKELATLREPRPLFIGEFGPYIDDKMFTWENVVGKVRDLIDTVEAEPAISGALLWSMYSHREAGGYYWHQVFTYAAVWSYHWPGFPSAVAQREQELMTLLREAAYRIDGKPVPLVPVPDSPELLPFTEVPLFSWRGSAGASGYDIERAPQVGGPWKLLAKNVSDADVAYRPLYSDTTARAGETWFYRVSARNASGVSGPSNVVGPVSVSRVCLVDELQDFSRTSGHAPTLKLDNAYNGRFAEYLFRAQGVADDWIGYAVPGSIGEVRVTAFYDGEKEPAAALVLEVSADGKAYEPLGISRTVRALSGTPGGPAAGRTSVLADYVGRPAAGRRYLRVRWQGAAELDRVEIYHPGK